MTTDTIILRCSCCNLPFATIQRGVLVIQSRHGGDRHTNVIRLEEVRELLEQQDITIQTRPSVLH